ncbi:MAG: hypothetical protein ACXIUM_06075 [Wenzhouxiangella sp.]
MNQTFHDIRLLAGFEIEPKSVTGRSLNRAQAEQLATALAADLARIAPDLAALAPALLVSAGSLLEPAEMLRPKLPVWAAMADLAGPSLRDPGFDSQVLAIGSHGGRLPDARLSAPSQAPLGRFVGVPLLLAVPADSGPELAQFLESELFERGGLEPPARALLEQFCGARSVHGQLLTVNDLLALQHVQMDVAGLSPFWAVIEQVLLASEQDAEFSLPAGLAVRWQGDPGRLEVDFQIFDRFELAPERYPLWQRAYRSLIGLAEAHGLPWQVRADPDLSLDTEHMILIHEAGDTESEDGVTEQAEIELGLIAWTVAEHGRVRHIYPLNAAAVNQTRAHWSSELPAPQRSSRLCSGGDPPRLIPA